MKKYFLLIIASIFIFACGKESHSEDYKRKISELEKLNEIILEESSLLINSLENELERLKNSTLNSNSQLDDAKFDNLKKEFKILKNSKNKQDNIISNLESEIIYLKNQISILENSNRITKSENKSLKNKVNKIKSREEDLEKIIEESRKLIRSNPNTNQQERQNINRIERDLRSAFDELSSEIENY